jgi:hypothetical protein
MQLAAACLLGAMFIDLDDAVSQPQEPAAVARSKRY